MTERSSAPLIGIFWMLLAGLNFVLMTAIVNHLGEGLPAPQAAFLRFVFGLVFVVPVVMRLGSFPRDPKTLRLLGLRGVVHAVAVVLWFYAMARITMAEVTALNYLNPVLVTLGAGLLLGERLAARRLIAIGFAFVGALVILRPGVRELALGHLAILGAAASLAASYLCAKVLSARLDPAVIIAAMSVSVTVLLLPWAVAVWVAPTLSQLGWIALVAAFATAGHYAMTLAFRAAPVSVTQPVTFLQLVWSALLGWALFQEAIDPWVIAGGLIVIGAASFITWREAVMHRRDVTPHVNQTKS